MSTRRGQPEGQEPEGVQYTVRDDQGRILEIVTTDGQHFIIDPEGQEPDRGCAEGEAE